MESEGREGGVASVQENTKHRGEQQQELEEAQATLAKLCCNTIKCNLN